MAPSVGSVTGGYEVVISGTDLGDGADITNVTICGVSVASITSQSATQVVVMAGAAAAGLGDVRVYSTSFGETVKSNGFTYVGPSFALLGTNGAAVASGAAA
ncbi:MAG TPA: IPT/TIG domain-containing protein, partial [Kiritimatiellia bacterium]|nr:IPT/TIG domain-containing protein [Kiritimatiellia bacterium]